MDPELYNLHWDITFWLYIILGCPGIIFNFTALIVLFKAKKGELGLHLLLLKSLAFSDLLVCLLGVARASLMEQKLYDIFCLFNAIFGQCSFAYIGTFLNLVLIAVNHYIAIMKPLRYNQLMTRKHMVAALVTIWILTVLLSCIDTLLALKFKNQNQHSVYDFCEAIDNFSFRQTHLSRPVWKMFMAIISIGSVALCVLYIKIYQAARKNLRQTDALNQVQIQQHKERRHSVNTSLLLLGTFLLVYVPFCAVYISRELIYSQLFDEVALYQQFFVTTRYMEPILLVNSISDPLIYMMRLDTIKKTFKQMMSKPCKRSSNCESQGISHGHHRVQQETQL